MKVASSAATMTCRASRAWPSAPSRPLPGLSVAVVFSTATVTRTRSASPWAGTALTRT